MSKLIKRFSILNDFYQEGRPFSVQVLENNEVFGYPRSFWLFYTGTKFNSKLRFSLVQSFHNAVFDEENSLNRNIEDHFFFNSSKLHKKHVKQNAFILKTYQAIFNILNSRI